MSDRTKSLRTAWKWVAPLGGAGALALALFFYFHSPGHKTYHLTFTAGNKVALRHQLGVNLQHEVARHKCVLELVPSVGAEEALDLVNARKADLALVQGGLSPVGRPHVRQVATLHVEPMHLLVKPELIAATSASLRALRKKTVDLEEVGTGNYTLATAILNFVGLEARDRDPVSGYIPVTLGRDQLLAETDAARLPDAVFLVSTPPSPVSAHLVARHGYRLVPLPFAEAFAMRGLATMARDREEAVDRGTVVMGHVHATTIPAFTYGVEPAVPDRPVDTLGTRLLLVAHDDVPPHAVYQLVEATYASEFGRIVHPPLDARLMDLPPEFPWHAGAVLYQQRNAPLLSGAVMDSTHKGFAIFAAAASGLFVLWQWLRMHGQATQTKGFDAYISRVARIEERTLDEERGHPLPPAELLSLRDELVWLKTGALTELAQGELAGKELLLGFLLQINDVRDSITRRLQERGEPAGNGRIPSKGE